MRKPILLKGACAAISFVIAASATTPSDARSLEGAKLSAATDEDFFVFFHLKEKTSEDRGSNLVTHYFEPDSRSDILVSVDADKTGKILQMGLMVGRDFIDDPKTNVFARDIVKSFIDAATPARDAKETEGVVNEIFFRGTPLNPAEVKNIQFKGKPMPKDTKLLKVGEGDLKAGDVAIMMSGSVPVLPAEMSDVFKTFNGSLDTCEQHLTDGASLVMKNHTVPKGRFLEVRIDVKGVNKPRLVEVVYPPVPTKATMEAQKKQNGKNAEVKKPSPDVKENPGSQKGGSEGGDSETESKPVPEALAK